MVFRRKNEMEEEREDMNVPAHRESKYMNAMMNYLSFKPKETSALSPEESAAFEASSEKIIENIEKEIGEEPPNPMLELQQMQAMQGIAAMQQEQEQSKTNK